MQDTEHNRAEFNRLMCALAAAWRQKLSTDELYAYWLALKDLKLSEVRDGVSKAMREGGDFMPPAPIFRRLCGHYPESKIPYHQPWKGHPHELPPPTFESIKHLFRPKTPEELEEEKDDKPGVAEGGDVHARAMRAELSGERPPGGTGRS